MRGISKRSYKFTIMGLIVSILGGGGVGGWGSIFNCIGPTAMAGNIQDLKVKVSLFSDSDEWTCAIAVVC